MYYDCIFAKVVCLYLKKLKIPRDFSTASMASKRFQRPRGKKEAIGHPSTALPAPHCERSEQESEGLGSNRGELLLLVIYEVPRP